MAFFKPNPVILPCIHHLKKDESQKEKERLQILDLRIE